MNPHKPFRGFAFVKTAVFILGGCAALLAVFLAADGLTNRIQTADVAVVPGNRVNPDGSPSPWLQSRLDTTIELYRQGWFENIIVSGGDGKEGYNEGEVMKQVLVAAGIPGENVIVDPAGSDSYATALNSTRIMKEKNWHSALVVSQYYHISRMKLALRRFGAHPVYSAHAENFTYRGLISLAREVVAYPVYFFRKY